MKICMRCYVLEGHFSSECPQNKECRVCSECINEGHVWHQCKQEQKKCLNCGGNYSTMAMKCGKQKNILKKKKRPHHNKRQKNYLCKYQPGHTATQYAKPPTATNNKEELLKIHICVAHEQTKKKKEKPESYANELNKIHSTTYQA